jgi:hypothetical protein
MFMRFQGGGVGHKATHKHTESMSQEADTTIPNKMEDNFEESLGNREQLEDYETGSESNMEEGDEDGDEDEFDVEDGEETWGIDEYTAEGYAHIGKLHCTHAFGM